jgi:uncharacterized DUF497 family protein
VFEWDQAKAAANLSKHGISFEEAESAFSEIIRIISARRSSRKERAAYHQES